MLTNSRMTGLDKNLILEDTASINSTQNFGQMDASFSNISQPLFARTITNRTVQTSEKTANSSWLDELIAKNIACLDADSQNLEVIV